MAVVVGSRFGNLVLFSSSSFFRPFLRTKKGQDFRSKSVLLPDFSSFFRTNRGFFVLFKDEKKDEKKDENSALKKGENSGLDNVVKN